MQPATIRTLRMRLRRLVKSLPTALLLAAILSLAVTAIPALSNLRMNGSDDLSPMWKIPSNALVAVFRDKLKLAASQYTTTNTTTNTDTYAGAEYVLDEGILVSRTYPIDWNKANDSLKPIPRWPAPSWSVHDSGAALQWSQGTHIVELAAGWPFRSVAVARASADGGYLPLPPIGVAQANVGFMGLIWHTRWWALLADLAAMTVIVLVLLQVPSASKWLITWATLARPRLRRRRGQCVACAYPVGTLPRCPECGLWTDPSKPEEPPAIPDSAHAQPSRR